jgi:hypothetical protein
MKSKIWVYNTGHNILQENQVMPKLKVQPNDTESFGQRMARMRQATGYSQRDLARETGISQRKTCTCGVDLARSRNWMLKKSGSFFTIRRIH